MRIKKFLPYLAILLLVVPLVVAAATGPVRGAWDLQKIIDILDKVATWLYVIGIALAVIVIVIGGISYMTAGGDEEKTGKAKKMIITGLIGAAIIVLAGIILDTLVAFLG